MKNRLKTIATALACFAIIVFTGLSLTACGEKKDPPKVEDNATHVSSVSDLKTAIAKGGSIVLDGDIADVEEELVLTKDVTLNLNGKTISSKDTFVMNFDDGPYSLLTVKGATVTVTGNGTINAKKLYTFSVKSEFESGGKVNEGVKNSKLVIENGTFVGGEEEDEASVVYVIGDSSTCEIKGGHFSVNTTDKSWLLNTYDASEKSSNGSRFSVTGGTFVDFDPSKTFSDNKASHDFNSHVAAGYKVTKEGSNYTVVKE